MACCSTWSHSRLANDGTWLGWRSLGCLSGATDGGGTPDVDAERPSRQLALDSERDRAETPVSRGRALLQQAGTLHSASPWNGDSSLANESWRFG